MATTILKYAHTNKLFKNGTLNWEGDIFKIRMITSGYVFSSAHTIWDNGANDSTDPSFNEVSTGGGYLIGGTTIPNCVAYNDRIDADDVYMGALTKTFRGLIVVAQGTHGSLIEPVLFYILPDSTPADTVLLGIDYYVNWSDSGVALL